MSAPHSSAFNPNDSLRSVDLFYDLEKAILPILSIFSYLTATT